jgi:hypothetical protein
MRMATKQDAVGDTADKIIARAEEEALVLVPSGVSGDAELRERRGKLLLRNLAGDVGRR